MSPEHLTGPTDASGGPLSAREQITLSFFWLALNFQFAAFLPVVLPAEILLFVTPGAAGTAPQAVFLGWLSAWSAVISLIVQPVVGTLSDRTPGPFGRRRPYILAGTVVLIAGMASLGVTHALGLFIVGFVLVNIGTNVCTAAYQSLLPDRVPAEQRGAASGYMGFMTIIGSVGSLAIAFLLLGQTGPGGSLAQAIQTGTAWFYLLAGVILALGLVVTLVGVRETPLVRHPRDVAASGADRARGWRRLREGLVRLWVDPWRHHNFTWVFLTRCFVILGLTIFMTFIAYYFSQVAGTPNFLQATAAVAVLALLGAICSALTLGIVSDHTRRVPVVFLATILMAVASLAFVVAPDRVPLWPLGIIFGLGYGAYTSVDWALAVDALPSLVEAGKDMGIWNIASMLPAALAPLLGSMVIATADNLGQTALGYRVVFGLAAFFFLLGAVLVLRVQERSRGHDQEAVADALGA